MTTEPVWRPIQEAPRDGTPILAKVMVDFAHLSGFWILKWNATALANWMLQEFGVWDTNAERQSSELYFIDREIVAWTPIPPFPETANDRGDA